MKVGILFLGVFIASTYLRGHDKDVVNRINTILSCFSVNDQEEGRNPFSRNALLAALKDLPPESDPEFQSALELAKLEILRNRDVVAVVAAEVLFLNAHMDNSDWGSILVGYEEMGMSPVLHLALTERFGGFASGHCDFSRWLNQSQRDRLMKAYIDHVENRSNVFANPLVAKWFLMYSEAISYDESYALERIAFLNSFLSSLAARGDFQSLRELWISGLNSLSEEALDLVQFEEFLLSLELELVSVYRRYSKVVGVEETPLKVFHSLFSEEVKERLALDLLESG